MFKFQLRRSGRRKATVRVDHIIGGAEMVKIIVKHYASGYAPGDLGDQLTKTIVENQVRRILADRGSEAYLGLWEDEGRTEAENAALVRWAAGEIARLYPELVDADFNALLADDLLAEIDQAPSTEDTVDTILREAAVDLADEVIDRCTNMFGKLTPDVRERLLAVIRNPTPVTWDNAYSIVVSGVMRTLWQAVIKIDPEMPTVAGSGSSPLQRWHYVPNATTIIMAINNAVIANQGQGERGN